MPVSRAVSAVATRFARSMAWNTLSLMKTHHEERWSRASLSLHKGLWELAGVLERTDAAGISEMQDLKPGDGSQMPS